MNLVRDNDFCNDEIMNFGAKKGQLRNAVNNPAITVNVESWSVWQPDLDQPCCYSHSSQRW